MKYETNDKKYAIINLSEKEFVELMEAHHRWKWGNHMPFIVEKKPVSSSYFSGHSVKPKYVYRNDSSEFYVNESLIKTILAECFDEYDIQNIDFNVSYVKYDNYDFTKHIKRDEKGCPADQESMRMMRHPEMYRSSAIVPVFYSIVIYAKTKNNDMDNEYKLSL